MKKSIAVVYHSGYGHTEVIAKAIAEGASLANIESFLIKVQPDGKISEENWNLIDQSSAIIFGAPTYMGSVSGPFKLFMDASSRNFMTQKWKNKIAGGFTNSGGLSGDKLSSLMQLVIFACQHGMVWVGSSQMSSGKTNEDVNRLTSFVGVMAQSDNDSPEVTPPSGDISSAKNYGARIAEFVLRL